MYAQVVVAVVEEVVAVAVVVVDEVAQAGHEVVHRDGSEFALTSVAST